MSALSSLHGEVTPIGHSGAASRCDRRRFTIRHQTRPKCVYEGSADTYHDHIHRGQDTYIYKWPETASECTSRGTIIHDLFAECNTGYRSCIIRSRGVRSEAVSDHFPIYLGLGASGRGTCLHSLHFTGKKPPSVTAGPHRGVTEV